MWRYLSGGDRFLIFGDNVFCFRNFGTILLEVYSRSVHIVGNKSTVTLPPTLTLEHEIHRSDVRYSVLRPKHGANSDDNRGHDATFNHSLRELRTWSTKYGSDQGSVQYTGYGRAQ